MDIDKTTKKVFSNGAVDISINTLYDLLDANSGKETIDKWELRELIEQLEEYTA